MSIRNINEDLNTCLCKDVFYFKKQWQRLSQVKDEAIRQVKWIKLQEAIAYSQLQYQERKQKIPRFEYPDLPIVEQKEKIIKALQENKVIIVAGETGSGKTTQLPKICLEAGFGARGLIGHTQPRRIAARNVAIRVADELNSMVGAAIGYKVRFSDRTSEASYIKIMTDGILLSETQADKWLTRYDCIIIDEAHERSLNIDFLLGYLKTLLVKRKDLKVIITSATIDVERFSQFYDAPLITISGRTYDVEVNYLGEELELEKEDPTIKVLQAVEMAFERGNGDILIFQSGEKEIREVCEVLNQRKLPNTEILPLFARQSVSEQQKAFKLSSKRRIIVTTNVAETSITVPNIRFVIDNGMARISRYSYKTKLQRLPIEAISQASCEQRKGRCGRVGPGICYRLYSKEDYLGRNLFTEPEILRTNLAGVVLKMLSLGLKNILAFPFIDPPDGRYIKDAFGLLTRLEAVDENNTITSIGHQLAQLPIEPKLGRMIIAANEMATLKEILIIVSGLSIVDPRERPPEKREKADLVHAQFNHEQSDFMSLLHLWKFVYEHKGQLSHKKFRLLCKENMLSYIRVCEWFDIHQQLHEMAKELGFKFNQVPGDYVTIHRALLTGLLDSIGHKLEKTEYEGTRNIKFFVHPASILFKKTPPWLMALEIVYTTKTYARTNAVIESKWVEEIGKNLLKKQYFEPYFDIKEQRIVAFEKATLFGLEIIHKRKVSFERIDPLKSREIFIQHGLVEKLVKSSQYFYVKNNQTLAELKELENRVRIHPLADERKIFEFYDKKLSAEIVSTKALEKWLENTEQQILIFTQEDICLNFNKSDIERNFPLQLMVKGQPFALEYCFDFSSSFDGVTLLVPIEALAVLKEEDFTWLIPGLLSDKIEVVLKGLSKKLRLQLSPIPEYVVKAKNEIVSKSSTFYEALLLFIQKQTGQTCTKEELLSVSLPPYLKMHFRVLDSKKNVLGEGDDLLSLYHALKHEYQVSFTHGNELEKKGVTHWDFGDIPQEVNLKRGAHFFHYYPALVNMGKDVALTLFESRQLADFHHPEGLARLYLFYLGEPIKQFKKNTSSQKKALLKISNQLRAFDELVEDILFLVSYELFVLPAKEVRNQLDFENQLKEKRSQYLLLLNQTFNLSVKILNGYLTVQTLLEKNTGKKEYSAAISDIRAQLQKLLPPNFILKTPLYWLKRLPIYLEGIVLRLDKIARQPQKDKEDLLEVISVHKAYDKKLQLIDPMLLDLQSPLTHFRWRIEELRISLFAQSLKTSEPVSKVRLLKLLDKL